MQIKQFTGGLRNRPPHASPAFNRVLPSIFLAFFSLACPKRIDFGPRGEIKDANELLKLTSQAEEQLVSIVGDARLKINSRQGSGSVSLFVAVSRPSFVHLETLGFFGKLQAVLVSDGARFGLYQADQGKYYRGPASPQNLSRFLPLVRPIPELVQLMLGQAPRVPARAASLQLDSRSRNYLVTLVSDGVVQRLWVEPANCRVRKSEIPGADGYQVEFDDFESAGATAYPRQIKLSASNPPTQLELQYKDVSVNGAVDGALFEMVPPSGVPVIEVDEEGNPVRSMRSGSHLHPGADAAK